MGWLPRVSSSLSASHCHLTHKCLHINPHGDENFERVSCYQRYAISQVLFWFIILLTEFFFYNIYWILVWVILYLQLKDKLHIKWNAFWWIFDCCIVVYTYFAVNMCTYTCIYSLVIFNKFVRPRWPYDMRPSVCHCNSLGGATWRSITGRTDRQTDRVRRNMRPPPREEGRIITSIIKTCVK